MILKSGHEVVYLDDEEKKKLTKNFTYYPNGLIKLQPGGWTMMPNFVNYADKYYEFEFKPTDVVIMTYAKCGTTWTQEIVWTMINNVNFEHKDADQHLMFRSPFLDVDPILENMTQAQMERGQKPDTTFSEFFEKLCPGKDPKDGVYLQVTKYATPDPRIIKTHLSFSLLPPNMLDKCKVIYVARNPKDVVLSYFHHHQIFKVNNFCGSLDEFMDYFRNGDLLYDPFWEHVNEGWERKCHKNMHWMFYEDMKRNPLKEFARLNEFLETNLSEEKLKNIVEYTSFDSMKKRDPMLENMKEDESSDDLFNVELIKKEGGFFRKGKVGGWKDKLTVRQNEILDKWIKENEKKIGIHFTY